MGNKRKLKSYICDDRPLKLKSYVSSRKICLRQIKLGQKRNLLHYCALYGTADMLRCLLKLNCDPSQQDRHGNLPLHLTLQRGLTEDIDQAREIFVEMVTPLLDAYPLGRDVENREGITGHDLLTSLKKRIKSYSKAQAVAEDERVKEEDDDLWRQKLNEEAMFEAEEGLPRYSYEEDFLQEKTQQSYDVWSERIRQEYAAKQRRERHTFFRDKKRKIKEESGSASSKDFKEQRGDEKLRQSQEEMKKNFKPAPSQSRLDCLRFKKQRYESKFVHLLSHLSGRTLTFASIPWPSPNLDSVESVLFCDLPDRKSALFQKYLRTQQIRWHPDKFTQKFGDHLHPDHTAKIMGRVKAISQILNHLKASSTNK